MQLIQDGHRKVLEESVRYKARIEALGNFWYHLENSDYGRPNSSYCKMLVSRLEFHSRVSLYYLAFFFIMRSLHFYNFICYGKLVHLFQNHSIPGNLRLNANQIKALTNADVNQSFELSVEMLDQMDNLLDLQAAGNCFYELI